MKVYFYQITKDQIYKIGGEDFLIKRGKVFGSLHRLAPHETIELVREIEANEENPVTWDKMYGQIVHSTLMDARMFVFDKHIKEGMSYAMHKHPLCDSTGRTVSGCAFHWCAVNPCPGYELTLDNGERIFVEAPDVKNGRIKIKIVGIPLALRWDFRADGKDLIEGNDRETKTILAPGVPLEVRLKHQRKTHSTTWDHSEEGRQMKRASAEKKKADRAAGIPTRPYITPSPSVDPTVRHGSFMRGHPMFYPDHKIDWSK